MTINKSDELSMGLTGTININDLQNKMANSIPRPLGSLDWYKRITEHASVTSQIRKHFAYHSTLIEMTNSLKAYKNPFEITEPIRKMANTIRPAGSIIKAFDISNKTLGSFEILRKHAQTYAKQQHIFDLFSTQYINLTGATIAGIARNNIGNLSGLTNFDALSAKTLQNIIDANDGEDQANENLDTLSDILTNQREIKDDVGKLFKEVAKLAKKGKKVKKKQLVSLQEQFTMFLHKTVLRSRLLTLQQTHILVQILYFVIFVVFYDALQEWKGGAILDDIFKDGKTNKIEADTTKKSVVHDTTFILQDFTVRDATMFLRNSIKTNRLGKVLVNTKVIVIAQKPQWCLVEALVVTVSKKGDTLEKVRRGWVRKRDLDYFQ